MQLTDLSGAKMDPNQLNCHNIKGKMLWKIQNSPIKEKKKIIFSQYSPCSLWQDFPAIKTIKGAMIAQVFFFV